MDYVINDKITWKATVNFWLETAREETDSYTCNSYSTALELILHFSRKISTLSRLVFMGAKHFDRDILTQYRLQKNPDFKSFFIGQNGKSTKHEIYVDGCNEQVLMYMSESGKENVLLEIQECCQFCEVIAYGS